MSTTTGITTDPALYALLERIVREAPPATTYRLAAETNRPDGSKYRHDQCLKGSEKDQIPWGVHDAIIDVTWDVRDGFGASNKDYVKIYVDTFNNGIGVVSTLHPKGPRIFGVRGTLTPHSDACQALENEDEVVAYVLGFIRDAADEDIFESLEDAESCEIKGCEDPAGPDGICNKHGVEEDIAFWHANGDHEFCSH